MGMTAKPTPVPDEDAFAAIKAGIDSLPPGVKMFLNSGIWLSFRDIYPFELTQCFSRVLRTWFNSRQSRASRSLLRQVPTVCRSHFPLRQGWITSPANGGEQ